MSKRSEIASFLDFINSHNMCRIPEKGICVKICSWIKPEVKLLLSVTLALSVHIGMNYVRITTQIPQELKIYLIPG